MVLWKKITLLCGVAILTACVNTAPKSPSSVNKHKPDISSGHHPQQPLAEAIADSVQHVPASADISQTELSELDDVWHRIARQMTIVAPDNSDIRAQRAFYQRHQKFLDQVSTRAEPFLYHIVLELEKRRMPVELALLPIVESAFNPLAQAGAPAGLWQMVPQTARNFGLKRNDWYDGRKDPIASTAATLDYLQYLYNMLGQDWLNAVAGYNSGEGNIEKAINRNKKAGLATDFWSLKLSKKSTAYMPKWLALIDMVKNPDRHGVRWGFIANRPNIGFAKLRGPVDLAQAADLAGLSLTELKKLNPAFRRTTTAPGGPYVLVLPIDKLSQFERQSQKLTLQKIAQSGSYKVKSGDSLGSIAKRHQLSVAALKKANQLTSDQLKIGQQLWLPGIAEPVAQTAKMVVQKQRRYEVKSGDNLWDLSRKFKVKTSELARLNKITEKTALKPGQQILIPAAEGKNSQRDAEPSNSAGRYTVKSGDSLDKIARKHKIKLADLMRWNQLTKNSKLQPGQRLTITANTGSSS